MDEITLMCSDAMNQGYEEGLKEGERLFKPKWISVDTEQPQEMKDVLLCDYKGKIYLGHYWGYDSELDYQVFYVGDFRQTGISYWMPLPEPPKES